MLKARWTVLTLLVVIALPLLAACAATPNATPSIQLTITAHDYSFDVPTQIDAGLVRVSLKNDGKEPHHAQVLRLNDGVTNDQFMAALQEGIGPTMALVTLPGGPAVVDPGLSQDVTLDLSPGNYFLLCLVPSPDGVPHLAKGMVAPFKVVESSQAGNNKEVKVDATIRLKDFQFELPEEIKAGAQTWAIVNDGPQPHEINIIRLADGKTMEDVMAWMENPQGQPPYQNVGGFQGIDVGKTGWLHLDLKPGSYVALCHIPDPGSGKEHAELGMIAPFTIQ